MMWCRPECTNIDRGEERIFYYIISLNNNSNNNNELLAMDYVLDSLEFLFFHDG